MAAALSQCEWPLCDAPASKQTEQYRTYCAQHYAQVQENRKWLQNTYERASQDAKLIGSAR